VPWYHFGTGCIVHYVQIVHGRGRIGRSGRSRTRLHAEPLGWGPKGRWFKSSRPDYPEARFRSGRSALKADARRGDHQASAPALSPKTWYGMPAYAKDGKVVCFFQSAQKFKSRYATFGFSDEANLDKGAMWPTSFALKELTAAEEAKIGALVKKAVS
jgi:hypothetical protein